MRPLTDYNSESLYNRGRAAEKELIHKMTQHKGLAGWLRPDLARKYVESLERLNSRAQHRPYRKEELRRFCSIFKVDGGAQLHFYKRRLTPVQEGVKYANHTSPFQQNFTHYTRGVVGSNFARKILELHPELRIVKSRNQQFTTFQLRDADEPASAASCASSASQHYKRSMTASTHSLQPVTLHAASSKRPKSKMERPVDSHPKLESPTKEEAQIRYTRYQEELKIRAAQANANGLSLFSQYRSGQPDATLYNSEPVVGAPI